MNELNSNNIAEGLRHFNPKAIIVKKLPSEKEAKEFSEAYVDLGNKTYDAYKLIDGKWIKLATSITNVNNISPGSSGGGSANVGVTSVTATTPISSSGGLTPNISHNSSGVTAGSYTNANITVDAFGHITNASNGSSGAVVPTENLLAYNVNGSAPLSTSSRLTIETDSVIWKALLANDPDRITKDFGTAYFDVNFEIQFEFMVTSACANQSIVYFIMLANSDANPSTIITASGDFLGILFNQTLGGTKNLGLRECNNATLTTTLQAINTDVLYYCTLKRDESVGTYGTLYLYVYSDLARTNLLWTLTVTLTEKQDFRYFLAISGNNTGGTAVSYGFVSNIRIISA